MKQYLILGFVLILGLASCQTTNRPLPGETAASIPAVTVTHATPTPTSTSVATVAPVPTLTPALPATPLPVASLTEKGLLLIWDDRTKQYEVLDLNTGNSPRTIRWNSECEWELLPLATTTVCERQSGQQYLLDILNGTTQDLPIWNAQWIRWSPNGKFLVYSQNIAAGESIFSYEISTHTIETLTTQLNREEQHWLDPPVLSADGQTLIVARNYAAFTSRVFEIVRGTSGYHQVGLDKPFSTENVAWSPVSSQFVYGATDIEQEIGPMPNYLFLADMQMGKIRELAKSPAPLFLWPQSLEWSPTGKQIAVGLWDQAFKSEPQACIINIDTTRQLCLPALRSTNGSFIAWSPSGEHIAFVDLEKDLVISNPDGTGAVKLLENVPSDFLLFWR